MMLPTIDFLPTYGDYVCDFGMDDADTCSGEVHWVTMSSEWVVPMFACNECKASYDY